MVEYSGNKKVSGCNAWWSKVEINKFLNAMHGGV